MPGKPASRIGDIGCGVCSCGKSHGACGMLITGSPDVITTKSPQSRLTDIIISFCHGCPGIMVGSSGTVNANSLGCVRPGDDFSGSFTGNLITGSPNVNIGD